MNLCTNLFRPETKKIFTGTKLQTISPDTARSTPRTKINPRSFDELAGAIESHAPEFQKILAEFENDAGARYEMAQVLQTLRGVRMFELPSLSQIDGIQNVAVYGSTNIPLYTLILHAVIPASTGADVWFRTPQLTRSVYVRLFDLMLSKYPEFPWDKIHLLTEKRDVQYDNFRKMHVLGLNLNGTRFLRKPSEVVLFTGSPKTGDDILASNRKKLEELITSGAATDLHLKQIFLKFGSGLNPVVVTASALGSALKAAVEGTVTAVRINSSQDCIAPKVYFVHRDSQASYFQSLMERLSSLRFGSTTDPQADFGPVHFTEDFSQLAAFKEKYKKFLLNQNAVLDPTSKQVDPHVFVIPFSEFQDMELADHFAPFLVHVTYSTEAELSIVASDSRLKDRAMFASIYGDPLKQDVLIAKKLLEDSLHTTIINESIFADESGNFPFGGFSQDASTVTELKVQDSRIIEETAARPLLFSLEAQRAFSKK